MAGHITCYSTKHLVLKFVSQGNNSLHCDPKPKRNPNPYLYTNRYSYPYPDAHLNLDSNLYS